MPKSRTQPLGALEHPLAHRVAVGVVVVDRLAPGRLVALGEVRAEGLERLRARRADVVVDDVEDHAEPGARARRRRAARARAGRRRPSARRADVDAVVAPAAVAGELGDRHQLDRGDAQLGQRRQVRDRRPSNVPSGGERADVQLVDDELVAARAREAAVADANARGSTTREGPRSPSRLPARARVGQRAAVEHVAGSRRRRAPATTRLEDAEARRARAAHVARAEPQRDRRRRRGAQTRNSTRRRRSRAARAERPLPRISAASARGSVLISGTSQTHAERRQRQLGRERLAVPGRSARPRRRRGCRRREPP